MKVTITAIALLFALTVTAQSLVADYLKENKYSLTGMFLAGATDGTLEILRHDYSAFKDVFPNANDEYWNPDVSWRNKWRGGDPERGEKFPGSSTVLAWTTDGYHLLRTTERFLLVGSVVFHFGERRHWTHYALDFLIHGIVNRVGFAVTYEVIFKH